MGIGDWGLGIGDWAPFPIPNPQSPIPNPQSPYYFNCFIINNSKNLFIKMKYFNYYYFSKKFYIFENS